eukprot:2392104-Ditylum_brightwellii.AAC.1
MNPEISSVLDWEEAQYADPRFELLLLCRKVCANRYEANLIWSDYTAAVQHWSNSNSSNIVLGGIEPWLKLEGVHAIMTYLVQ